MWCDCLIAFNFFLYAYDLFSGLHFKVKMKVNSDRSHKDKKAAIQKTDSDLVHDQLHGGIILQLCHKTLSSLRRTGKSCPFIDH